MSSRLNKSEKTRDNDIRLKESSGSTPDRFGINLVNSWSFPKWSILSANSPMPTQTLKKENKNSQEVVTTRFLVEDFWDCRRKTVAHKLTESNAFSVRVAENKRQSASLTRLDCEWVHFESLFLETSWSGAVFKRRWLCWCECVKVLMCGSTCWCLKVLMSCCAERSRVDEQNVAEYFSKYEE